MAASTRRSRPASTRSTGSTSRSARAGRSSTSTRCCSPAAPTWSRPTPSEPSTSPATTSRRSPIAAMFQKDLRALLSHPGVGNDTLAALKGKPILIGAAGRTSFWLWLKAKYGYTDEQIRPYTFNFAPFLADKNISMQGFITSEPYRHPPGRRRSGDPSAGRQRLRQLFRHPGLPAQDGGGAEGRGAALRRRLDQGLEELPHRRSGAGQCADQAAPIPT